MPPTRREYVVMATGVAVSVLLCAIIAALAPRLAAVPHLPDQGASWYFWKLAEPTTAGRLSAWLGYLLHQGAFWALIAYGQQLRPRGLGRLQAAALGVNAAFIVAHIAQTHLFYDGLAQDVSIWSSLGSVAFLLIWVILMENPRRGIFFGHKVGFAERTIAFARRYHGYVFSWATVYTFWYHPAEGTWGHLLGFFYVFVLMLQGSLMFTAAHENRYWTFALEALVVVHGTVVAVAQGNRLWPMFTFGFAAVFIITQMHGLGLGRWVKAALAAAFLAAMFIVYAPLGLGRLNEVVRIPIIDYVAVFVLAALLSAGLRLFSPRAEQGHV